MAVYHKVPRAAVDVIIKTDNGIVLTKRSIPPFKGMWHIPGGTILFKEPIRHAINRVAFEELGVKVKVIRQIGMIEYLDDGGRHTVCGEYLTKISKGDLSNGKQSDGWKYFKEIPKNIIPEQGDFLRKHYEEVFEG